MAINSHQSEIVEAEGHLIDSNLLNVIFDKVIERGGAFEVQSFTIGRTNDDMSRLRLKVAAESEAALHHLLEDLVPLGCHALPERDALLRSAPRDGCVAPDFYSTTNQRTRVRHQGAWLEVAAQRMDAVVVVADGVAACRKLRDVRAGDPVVCGADGVRVVPEFRERDRLGFAFMTNDISSERRVEVSVERVATMMREVREAGGRIVVVAGPLVVHTGGVGYFCEIIRQGYVDAVLAGNALAVHDAELAMFGTSLGVDLESGATVEDGHRNHMRAINAVNSAGGLTKAVESGVLSSGVMYECVRGGVDYVLAGSIRDDGPLVDTVMDLVAAQERYAELLEGASMVVMLASMLHSIGVGNMLPAWVRVVCVDINPAVVTKLADRGSSQTAGIVTDVGLFLHQLARRLAGPDGAQSETRA
ncbi:MAG: TIGR00300 family protein [Vicinamibacterales bacterium]|jgi:lysine-ketoglutarate reductase/saccharopine dehydrogenase-like protein (TIGR00300 family)|nr:TIGR00300 family protein [Acidobacteriota bacterium]MDP6373675.1 TIGR00300 family protein [Vicinamibacterales bacterium]MDP6609783.1 TIGR00300 family protein [Vicinamibacterales bacterium]HAK55475.1 TIGR00300 family protein [Acidobacteriota bacterium]|tara:strand:+ start:2307 stop:3560 length:1254 start_codon:yes stop_codon:yes gene_type:complete